MTTISDTIITAGNLAISGKLLFKGNDADIPEGIGYRVMEDWIIIYPIKNRVPSWNMDDIVVIPQEEWRDYDVYTGTKAFSLCVDYVSSAYIVWHYYRSQVHNFDTGTDSDFEAMRQILEELKEPNKCNHADVIFGMIADFFREENQWEWLEDLFLSDWGIDWLAESADDVHQEYKHLANYEQMVDSIRNTISKYEANGWE